MWFVVARSLTEPQDDEQSRMFLQISSRWALHSEGPGHTWLQLGHIAAPGALSFVRSVEFEGLSGCSIQRLWDFQIECLCDLQYLAD
jgi:hypothetical protein